MMKHACTGWSNSHGVFRSSVFLLCAVAAVTLAPAGAAARTTLNEPGVPTTLQGMTPQGQYVVFVQGAAGWVEAGRVPCDKEFRTQDLDLSAFLHGGGPVRVRIAKRGGGPGHIDAVSLGGHAPAEITGSPDPLASFKVAKRDYDVIDASGGPLEFVFASRGADARLSLTARVEGVRIAETPFLFPSANLYRPLTAESEFYTYRIDSRRAETEGIGRSASRRAPFFKEYSLPGTGHPSAYTYGWVTNDDRYLYVTIDFAADDTCDGDKDYTKVFVRTGAGVREFKISERSTRWGTARFLYTDKASYQHKVYDFRIPLAEIDGTNGDAAARDLQLAFAAYGTSAPLVIDTNPDNGAVDVALRNLVITGTFNYRMASSTIDNTTFLLENFDAGRALMVPNSAIRYVDNTASMDLGAAGIVLDPRTTYRVTFTTGIYSIYEARLNYGAGNTFADFTTAAADNTLHLLLMGETKSPGCMTLAPSTGSGAARAGAVLLLVLPAVVLLVRRRIRSRRPERKGGSLPLLLIVLLPLAAATAEAGMFGAPSPDVAAGQLSAGAGYFYDVEKWKPETRIINVSGGPRVIYEEPKMKQAIKYLEGGVGLCNKAQAYVRLGVADRNAPQFFDGPNQFAAAAGVRANLYSAPSFRIGTVFEAAFAPTARRDVTFVDGGTTWTGAVRIVHPWTVSLGVAAQAKLGPATVYGGPFASYGEFVAKHDLVSPSRVAVSSKYKEKNNFGGFAGAGVTLLKGLTFGVEAQFKSDLSGGANLSYAF